jgi:hypothetical protein
MCSELITSAAVLDYILAFDLDLVTIILATLLGLDDRCHSSLPYRSPYHVRSGGLRMAKELPGCNPSLDRVMRWLGRYRNEWPPP